MVSKYIYTHVIALQVGFEVGGHHDHLSDCDIDTWWKISDQLFQVIWRLSLKGNTFSQSGCEFDAAPVLHQTLIWAVFFAYERPCDVVSLHCAAT